MKRPAQPSQQNKTAVQPIERPAETPRSEATPRPNRKCAPLKYLQGELNVIADSINKVQEVASDDVPPTANPVPLEAYLRPDVAETPLTQQEAIAGGPKTEAGMFVAPRILGSEE